MATAARAVMGKASKRKQKLDPVVKLAMSIVPAAQVANGRFREANVANFTEAQQRHSVRSKEVKTVRRLSHMEWLVSRRTLTPRQGQICQWYADQHEVGYSTVGIVADYYRTGGHGGYGVADMLAKHQEQSSARENYAAARAAISPSIRHLFERVVLHGLSIGVAGNGARYSRLSNSFRLAVDQIEAAVGHLIIER